MIPLFGGLGLQTEASKNLQIQGVLVTGLFIAIADFAVLRLKIVQKKTKTIPNATKNLFIVICVTAGLLIFFKAKNFTTNPFFDLLSGVDPKNVALEREKIDFCYQGWIEARLLNFLIPISGILVFGGLVVRRRIILASFCLVIFSGVLCFSTAKAPAFLFLFSCLLFLGLRFPKPWVYLPFLLLMLLPLFALAAVFYFQTEIHPSFQKHFAFAPASRVGDDASDQYRRLRGERLLEQNGATYLAYRLFFVPVGVSSRWYEFGQRPLADKALALDETSSLANAIGRWRYTSRFPEEYLPHVRAYASLDADAFCRFAMPGVLLAALGYMAARIVFFLSCGGTTDPLLQGLYSLGLTLFSFVPYQGSLQALLGPQGVLPIILLGFLLQGIYCKKSTLVQQLSAHSPKKRID